MVNKIKISKSKDGLHIEMEKHMPIILHAEDQYRKGILIDICDECGAVGAMVIYIKGRRYCESCSIEVIKQDFNKIKTKPFKPYKQKVKVYVGGEEVEKTL